MPEKLERCVQDLINDPDFKPKGGQDRKSAAFAVCTAALKESSPAVIDGEVWYVIESDHYRAKLQTLSRVEESIKFCASDSTSNEWKIRLISAGMSANQHNYPKSVLHRDKHVFEGAPVHAAVGQDHSPYERGVRSIVGFIKNVKESDDGLDATFHVSDPDMQHLITDLYRENMLDKLMGFSVVLEGVWLRTDDYDEAFQITRVESTDLVRYPAAGGKFLSKESMAMTDGKVLTVLKAVNTRLMDTILLQAKLPDASVQRIRSHFKDRDFTIEEVEEAIKQEKDYLASVQKTIVENITKENTGTITMDALDKKIVRLDAVFSDGMIKKDNTTYLAYRSFREAYCDWTGRNYFDVSGQEVWEQMMRAVGYNSWGGRKKKVQEALSTAEWADVVVDRLHNALLLNYDRLPQYDDWKLIARVIPVTDYQPWRDTKVGGYDDLSVVAERGVYPLLTHPTDEQTSATLQKRGGIADQITRELVINDKIGAVSQIPKELARSAKRTLYKAVFDVLRLNAIYGPDSTALFAAAHANQGTVALSLAGLDAAVIGMRSQTKYGSPGDVLGLANAPRVLIVPNTLEGLAERLTNPSAQVWTQLSADTDTDQDVNRFRGKLRVVVVDYFTDPTRYYLVADPDQVAGIGVLFMNGREEPELFIQNDERIGETFSMDVMNIKVRHEFSTVLRDYRPFYRQTG